MKHAITVLMIFGAASLALADENSRSAPVKEPELRDELLRRNGPDQEVRKAMLRWTSKHGTRGVLNGAELSQEETADYEKLKASIRKVVTTFKTAHVPFHDPRPARSFASDTHGCE